MSREWTPVEAGAFRPQLVELLRARRWRRGNPLWEKMKKGLEDLDPIEEAAYKMLQKLRHSAGQAELKQLQLDQSMLKSMKVQNEIELLRALDELGIDREYKNNDMQDATIRPLYHFRLAAGGVHSIEIADSEVED